MTPVALMIVPSVAFASNGEIKRITTSDHRRIDSSGIPLYEHISIFNYTSKDTTLLLVIHEGRFVVLFAE